MSNTNSVSKCGNFFFKRFSVMGVFLSLIFVLFLSYAPIALATTNAEKSKPNIIIIMTDDIGYGDLGCYGGGETRGIPTPNLDRMAREGLRLTSFYTQPSCTPTRAALITGRLPIRSGLLYPHMPNTKSGLHKDEVTLAEVLSNNGYNTVMHGKWHLGDAEYALPHKQGFDYFYGFLYHCDAYIYESYYDYNGILGNIRGVVEGYKGKPSKDIKKIDAKELENLDLELKDKTIKYIRDHANEDKPFFIYHGMARAHYKSFPHPDYKGKSEIGEYGDVVMEVDDIVGEILKTLKDEGIAEKTMVVFTSDNGPHVERWPDCGYTPFRGSKGTTWEGGVRQPCLIWWPGIIEAGRISDELVSVMDFYTTAIAIAGGEVPAVDESGKPYKIDGNDQTKFLKGDGPSATKFIHYYAREHLMAIRHDKWKVHFKTAEKWESAVNELNLPIMVDLKSDPREQMGLITKKGYGSIPIGMEMRRHLAEFRKYPNRSSEY